MSKSHRGRPVRRGKFVRGTCSITGRTGVKLLYEHKTEGGESIKVSKTAFAKFKNIREKEARVQKRIAASAKKEEPAPVAAAPAEAEVVPAEE